MDREAQQLAELREFMEENPDEMATREEMYDEQDANYDSQL